MSETKNLQLFKHDNPSTNTEQFDIEKALNENWDKIDDAYGINNINIQELQSKVIALETQNAQLESQIPTGESEGNPIHLTDSSDLPCEIVVVGNTKQNGEPTPEAPVEIVTVGQDGSVEIDVVNKNFAKIVPNQTLTATGITVTTNEDQSITMNGTGTGVRTFKITDILESKDYADRFEYNKKIAPKGDYKVALEVLSGTLGSYFTWGIMYTDGTYTDRPNKTTSDEVTVTDKEISFIYVYHSSRVFNNFTFRVSVQDINDGGIYMPHESQKVILPIQKEMLKIGEYEDAFIKQDGKWYEAHYSPKFVFDGTGAWTYDSQRYRFYRTIPRAIYAARAYALSSHFKNGNTETENNTFNVGTSQIFFRNESITSSANWKSWLAEQYANGTPLEVYYVLSTPELIPCTPEQEEILNSFYTYKNITNISVSGIGTVKVNYKKDLETINKNNEARIAALEAALVS